MSAAGFVLAINLFIAGIFATAFAVVAAHYRLAIGARWLCAAYAIGILNGLLEFILPHQVDARPASFAIFVAFLASIALCNIGLARHYRIRVPWRLLAGVTLVSLAVNLAILEMPRGSLLRGLLYQTPYAVMSIVGARIILSRPANRALDLALLALFLLSALNFIAKPILATLIGSGDRPQAYLDSTYAAISQSAGAIMLITNGLIMLLIIVRDMMADVTVRSETDSLSGLLNRRGFEDQADKARMLALRAGVPAVVVIADLDHFKAINDSFGHAAGDQAIMAFGQVLRASFDFRAVIGRLGGEEFAVLLPGADLALARGAAEAARQRLRELTPQERGSDRMITSSFGIAAMDGNESLADLLRRADAALYEAKSRGRDRVCVAPIAAVRIEPGTKPGPRIAG